MANAIEYQDGALTKRRETTGGHDRQERFRRIAVAGNRADEGGRHHEQREAIEGWHESWTGRSAYCGHRHSDHCKG